MSVRDIKINIMRHVLLKSGDNIDNVISEYDRLVQALALDDDDESIIDGNEAIDSLMAGNLSDE